MFENFIFGAQSQTQARDNIISASPTDTTCCTPLTSPTSSPNVDGSDLNTVISAFDAQDLSRDNLLRHFAPWSASHTYQLEDSEAQDEDMDSYFSNRHIPNQQTVSAPSTPLSMPTRSRFSPTCRRLQRQVNTQLQTSNTHMRDIKTLVQEMIASETQCTFHTPPTTTTTIEPQTSPIVDPSSPDIDEGFHDMSDDDYDSFLETWNLKSDPLRRASAQSAAFRNKALDSMRWCRSADLLASGPGAGVGVGGRGKVRSKIRMRKRRRGGCTVE